MKKIVLPQILLVILLIVPTSALSIGNVNAGKIKAFACVGCHGLNGIAVAPNFPNLAGQKPIYLAKAITAYRDGIRNDPIMKAMTGALTDTDIVNLSAYFASLPRKNQ